jgi:hypothetical protein
MHLNKGIKIVDTTLRTSSGRSQKEVGRSPPLSGGSNYRKEVTQDAGQAAPEQSGGWELEVVSRPALPAENGALPHQTNLQRTKNWNPT